MAAALTPARAAAVALATLTVIQTVLLRAHTVHATPPPPLFVNMYTESTKLLISLGLAAYTGERVAHAFNAHLLVLAVMYTAQNFLFVAMHRYLSSNQIFQVANLRILLIALGGRWLFKRKLSLLQILGVTLLAAACSIRTARTHWEGPHFDRGLPPGRAAPAAAARRGVAPTCRLRGACRPCRPPPSRPSAAAARAARRAPTRTAKTT